MESRPSAWPGASFVSAARIHSRGIIFGGRFSLRTYSDFKLHCDEWTSSLRAPGRELSGQSSPRLLSRTLGIWLPIAFHALYAFYIWYRGARKCDNYWTGNWMSRSAGLAGPHRLRLHRVWHTYTMRVPALRAHTIILARLRRRSMSPRLRDRTDCRLVAFRRTFGCLRRSEMFHRRQSAATISQGVPRVFPALERCGSGQLVHIQRALAVVSNPRGTITDTSHATKTQSYGKPVE